MLLLSWDSELVDEGRGPIEAFGLEEAAEESFGAMPIEDGVDPLLVGGIGGAAEGKSDRSQPKLEQPVAAARLQVVVPLRRRRGDELDLPGVEAETFIDDTGLRLDRAVVG